jgi:hypothetical protein
VTYLTSPDSSPTSSDSVIRLPLYKLKLYIVILTSSKSYLTISEQPYSVQCYVCTGVCVTTRRHIPQQLCSHLAQCQHAVIWFCELCNSGTQRYICTNQHKHFLRTWRLISSSAHKNGAGQCSSTCLCVGAATIHICAFLHSHVVQKYTCFIWDVWRTYLYSVLANMPVVTRFNTLTFKTSAFMCLFTWLSQSTATASLNHKQFAVYIKAALFSARYELYFIYISCVYFFFLITFSCSDKV